MKDKFIVLTYERVSTEEQTRTRSCDDQKTINDRYIREHGWILAKNGDFRDEGISGTKLDRPGLQDLIIRCQTDKEIRAIVVTETDRIARGNYIYIHIREELKKLGVKIIAVTQPMIDDTDEGEMFGEIIGAVNGLLPKITRRKSMRALDEKAARGWYPSKAPIGYKNVNIGTEERPDRIIEVNEEEVPYIRLIPKLYNEGKSYSYISDYLHDLGLIGREHGKVSPNEIRLILFNDFYLGEFDWRGKRYKGKHPPLFNKFEVHQARNRSKEIGIIHSTKENRDKFPFKQLDFYCSDCNCRITAENKKKHYKRTNRDAIYTLYHCTKSKGGWSKCKQPTINLNDLINEFAVKAVEPIEIDKELAEFMFEELNNEAMFREQERDKLTKSINTRLGQLDTELRNLFEMYISGRLPAIEEKTQDQLYEEFRFRKENEREKLLITQQKLLSESTEWKEKASNFFSLCIDAKNRFLTADEEKQAKFLKVITSNVLLNNKKLVVTHQFPFSELAKDTTRTSMLPYVHALRTHFLESDGDYPSILL